MSADVVIVGGGLAGAATALALRRRGVGSVVVVDKAEFPRDKPCGEGLLPHGLDLLRSLGLDEVVDDCGAQPFRGILYRCHGVVARGDFEGGATGRGVRRRLLDDQIRKRAQATGAVFVRGTATSLDARADRCIVALSDGTKLDAKIVVGADGPRSMVRHTLGLDGGPPKKPRYALRRHFRLKDGDASEMPDRVEVNVVSGYELYVTPVARGVVGVAALCEKSAMSAGSGKPDERLDALIAACAPVAERLAGSTPESQAMACGPLRVRSKGVGRGRVFLVGDAAGYVDAITGEGMSLALGTAVACADAIVSVLVDGKNVDGARKVYAKARMRAFRDHALLTFGLVELARHPFFAKRAIARLAKEPALFTRLLAVNNGTKSLASLGVFDFAKLAIGSAPVVEHAQLTS